MVEKPPQQKSVEEEPDPALVDWNAEAIRVGKESLTESIAGNAGTVVIEGKRCMCSAYNGLAHTETGKILGFANDPEREKNLAGQGGEHFRMIEAMRLDIQARKKFAKIIDLRLTGVFTPNARRVLEASVERWNELYGGEKSF